MVEYIYTLIKTIYNYGINGGFGMDVLRPKSCGRPAGRKKTAKIEIVIEPELKEEFMNSLHNEGKTASVQIGLWIRDYLKNNGEAVV